VQLPITIGLRRSFLLDILVGIGALLASAGILFFPRTIIWQAILLLLVWLFAAQAWRDLRPIFSAIRLERDGRLLVCRPDDQEFSTTGLLLGATVHPWLTVVRLNTEEGGCASLILTIDSLKPVDFRRLRVFLRWRAVFNASGDAV
jgi:toxin CptA